MAAINLSCGNTMASTTPFDSNLLYVISHEKGLGRAHIGYYVIALFASYILVKVKLLFIILSPSQLRTAPWGYETV